MNKAYELISEYYGDQRAKRSQVLLMQHINEGLVILDKLGAEQSTKEAFCLHPMLQGDDVLRKHLDFDFTGISTKVLLLTMEYRRTANSYLPGHIGKFVGFSCPEVKDMLIADKVQNYKDFMIHHHGTHERSDELYEYFHDWFWLLEIDYKELLKSIED